MKVVKEEWVKRARKKVKRDYEEKNGNPLRELLCETREEEREERRTKRVKI